MSEQKPPRRENSALGRLGLALGAGACVLPFPLFKINVPTLPGFEQGVLMAIFVLAMLTCSVVGSRRPLLGLLVLPVLFFGLSSLACWWIVAGRGG